jgi:hypothetical protein
MVAAWLAVSVPLKVKVGAAPVQDVTFWVAGLTVAAVVTTAALQVRLYVAGLEATASGLVTTRTAWPFSGSPAGVIVTGAAAIVPALVKVRVAGAEFCPLDSAQ